VQRALVAARLLTVSVTVLGLGSGAHVLGGGAAPSAGVTALVGALVLVLAAALARRPLSLPVLLPAALGGQLGVHAALSWFGGPVSAGTPAPAGHAAHGADAGWAVHVAASAPHAHPGEALMLVAHAVAVVGTVLLLVATERGVLDLARRWSAMLPALLDGTTGPVSTRSRTALPAVAPLRSLPVQRGGVGRRGPPAALRPCATVA
jgi:hypothetical protein